MAKVSRSKTRLPDFDPGELQDLIFTPAVGSGVGSHLLVSEATTEVRSNSTIVESQTATVGEFEAKPVQFHHQIDTT